MSAWLLGASLILVVGILCAWIVVESILARREIRASQQDDSAAPEGGRLFDETRDWLRKLEEDRPRSRREYL